MTKLSLERHIKRGLTKKYLNKDYNNGIVKDISVVIKEHYDSYGTINNLNVQFKVRSVNRYGESIDRWVPFYF